MFQLEDQYRLFDYSINVNDVIQLMVRVNENNVSKKSVSKVTANVCKNETPTPSCSSATSSEPDKVINILF